MLESVVLGTAGKLGLGGPADPSQATKRIVFGLLLLIFEDSVSSEKVFWPSAAESGSSGRSTKVGNGMGRKEIIYFLLK